MEVKKRRLHRLSELGKKRHFVREKKEVSGR
jgi:hypothetical protein